MICIVKLPDRWDGGWARKMNRQILGVSTDAEGRCRNDRCSPNRRSDVQKQVRFFNPETFRPDAV